MITRRDVLKSVAVLPFVGLTALGTEQKPDYVIGVDQASGDSKSEAKPNFKVGHFAKRNDELVRITSIDDKHIYFDGGNYKDFDIHWGWNKDFCEPVNFEVGSWVTASWDSGWKLGGVTIVEKYQIDKIDGDKVVVKSQLGSDQYYPRFMQVRTPIEALTPTEAPVRGTSWH